jgi:hypothetical protein
MTCPNCQAPVLPADRFCRNCGLTLPAKATPAGLSPGGSVGTSLPAAAASRWLPGRRLSRPMIIGGAVAAVLLAAGAGVALALVLGGEREDGPPPPSFALPTGLPTVAPPTTAQPSTPVATALPTPNTPLITPGPIQTTEPLGTPGPEPTPTAAPLDSSFCPAVDPSQWGPTSLFGKGFEANPVVIPSTGVQLFPAGRIRVVNQLGDGGGYTNFVDADNVARASFTQWEASKLRYLVVAHGGRFYTFEGRQEKVDAEFVAPPPCRVPPSDGQLVAWRAMTYQVTYDYQGWVYYVWTDGGEDMCGTDTIRLAYPALRQC